MRDCNDVSGKILHVAPQDAMREEKRSARTRLRTEKAVVDSPRFASLTF
jgi:hypothetical protein